jgi:DNA repair protein RadA/Sms
MARLRLIHRCTECATAFPKWSGRCQACGAWNSLVEDVEGPEEVPAALATGMSLVPAGIPTPIGDVDPLAGKPVATGIDELDRVLGGGLVAGSVTLLGGEPGIGKSTLLLQLLAAHDGPALYVTAEESSQQVRLRADRLDAIRPDLWLLPEMSLPNIVAAIDKIAPRIVVIDSIQTVVDPELGSTPGSVVQVRGCAHRLVQQAKNRSIAIILVGHVTKEGGLAGPRVLEHVVDTVLSFEGERHHALRMLRAVKHRFGPTSELGLFEMAGNGLRPVPDASRLFLGDRRAGVAGSVVVPTIEGQRPLLVEVQALTNPITTAVAPRRSAQGLDQGRLSMLIAVLERRAGVSFGSHEVYTSAVGGVRLSEPAVDLGLCMALVSAITGHPVPADVVVMGEIGLAGEVRQVAHLDRRLNEARRLGFARAIVPMGGTACDGITAMPAASLVQALESVSLLSR